MNDPVREISSVIYQLAATNSPDVQKATLEKYMTADVGFRHPVCEVKPGPNSRDKVLGIYQWYRVISPRIDLRVESIAFDPFKEVLYVEIVQWFKLFILPESFQAAPARLTTRLRLHKVDELYYIAEQEDFYHPTDFAALLFPISAHFVRAALYANAILTNVLVKGANLLGYWKPRDETEPITSDVGLYDNDKEA